jgi:hypothetical protein
MLTDAELSGQMNPELKGAFIAEAAAAERPAAEILRELVQAGLREADDSMVVRIPHEGL